MLELQILRASSFVALHFELRDVDHSMKAVYSRGRNDMVLRLKFIFPMAFFTHYV